MTASKGTVPPNNCISKICHNGNLNNNKKHDLQQKNKRNSKKVWSVVTNLPIIIIFIREIHILTILENVRTGTRRTGALLSGKKIAVQNDTLKRNMQGSTNIIVPVIRYHFLPQQIQY